MTPNYNLIPPITLETLEAWVNTGRPVGDFLRAVLSNDLREAFARADDDNIHAMFHIVAWLHNKAPMSAWGSPENFDAWGKAKLAEPKARPSVPGKVKIFCFNNGGETGWYSAVAMCEDGTVLAGHVCSDPGFMPHDLGITSNWKHDRYNAHCGEGKWELVWVEDPKTHPGLQAAYRLNQAGVAQNVEAAKP